MEKITLLNLHLTYLQVLLFVMNDKLPPYLFINIYK